MLARQQRQRPAVACQHHQQPEAQRKPALRARQEAENRRGGKQARTLAVPARRPVRVYRSFSFGSLTFGFLFVPVALGTFGHGCPE
jgi:hypothetical protein